MLIRCSSRANHYIDKSRLDEGFSACYHESKRCVFFVELFWKSSGYVQDPIWEMRQSP